ncbi:DUF2145 domain-containing protein [Achromobacter ruhlandii]|uniref:DUF2145 domain-containing protein n=1 Tax=Achromobacter ruhlandii TaxID=72557 RepID=A0ABM8LSS0_9BURK|nr:DUF2145 domain-containing protein [Achromobacter ruhlandii]AKP89478.1 hypothetical protein Axylo_1977 [Achromobacter xylosoxidans]AOU92324.1 DUF2145 domain-containing protein [Achromobacter ruhlandii]MCZ8431153.1 DUF2145 domain-containing protein [Achromobacter ruhlandii]MDC6087496.1 DUF2145 domain-containing protein [Achromobacter ruhlandii]MDC6150625.1 DUF2145 domain-containing protein [Achromobacter ruhlandii]
MNNIPASRIRRALCAVAACCALCGMSTTPALAGQGCADTALSANTLITAMDTAQRISAILDELPVNVVVLGRMGQDLSEYHLRYSHAGFAYRERAGAPWRIAHLLNECGTAQSDLWYEGLGNFFLDDLFRFDTLLLIPPEPIADALLTRIQQPKTLRSLFDPHYNMIAFPFSTRYQNSNAWVLETIVSAQAKDTPIGNREQAQAWLKTAGYQPSELRISALTRLGGRLFKANVAFDDHPDELRYAGRINAVTVDSLLDFLTRHEGWTVREVRAPH